MPLLLHRSVADVYHKVNGFWRQQFNMSHFRPNQADEAALLAAPSNAYALHTRIASSLMLRR
jgi:hypothetical protein